MPGRSKRPWRKELKKQQRKRRRRKAAIERDSQLEAEEASKLKDPAYQHILQLQAQLEEEQRRQAEFVHDLEEQAWLKRDALAHRAFLVEQQKREAAAAAEAAKRRKEEEALVLRLLEEQRQRDEKERRAANAAAEFDQMIQCMESFLNNEHGPAPAQLRRLVETRPGQNQCIIYERTNCCRYDAACPNNHRRPLLSKIIVIRHFFKHPLLEEEQIHKEYAEADDFLQLSEDDLCEAYAEFFADVVPELEGFGVIRNVRTMRNVLRQLRGHMFVEYFNERSALKAFIKLQGRFYAGKPLNVEFSSITAWESAVCGLYKKRKCPRGNKCYYIHLLDNPGNKYSTPVVLTRTTVPNTSTRPPPVVTPLLSWNMVTSNDVQQKSRNWRWSESPEVEIPAKVVAAVEHEKTEKKEKAETKEKDVQRQATVINKATEDAADSKHATKKSSHEDERNAEQKSRRRRKKHKHEKEKPHEKHKRKRSRSSERAVKQNEPLEAEKKVQEKRKKEKRREDEKGSNGHRKHSHEQNIDGKRK